MVSGSGLRSLVLVAVHAALALVVAAPAAAEDDLAAQTALAERFAPVVALVDQPEACGPGEPYQPTDVEAVLGRDDVALRGPWTSDDLIEVGPTAQDIASGLLGYHLDLPGDPLRPGCGYEEWSDVVTAGSPPTVYAHVATEEGVPGRLALQYWLYYPFNDYNNKHESDWEMVQLEFDADDAASALGAEPVRAVFAQHEGGEVAAWDDPRLTVVDGTHPEVHPAAGSHATYFGDALYLGRSASQGFGCDDARGASTSVSPAVVVIPADDAAARAAFPWIGYEGRWGQREEAFYNGPTGPNMKTQWDRPFTWSEEEGRDRSYAVPASSLFGTGATDLFCTGVATGSDALRQLTANPVVVLVALVAGVLVVRLLARLTTWRPSTPLRLVRRRTVGQVLTASGRMYGSHPWVFTLIGVVGIPATALGSWAAQLGEPAAASEDVTSPSAWLAAAGLAGSLLSVLAALVLQGAAMQAVAELDAGHQVSAWRALRMSLRRLPATVGALGIFLVVLLLLLVTVLLVPVAVVVAVLWALWLPAIHLEHRGPVSALRRSATLVRRRVVPVLLVIGVANLTVSAVGPLLGFGILLAGDIPFAVGNVVSAVTYALLSPFVGIATTYVYADVTTREAHPLDQGDEVLPAESELAGR
jgi:hypothetical protein